MKKSELIALIESTVKKVLKESAVADYMMELVEKIKMEKNSSKKDKLIFELAELLGLDTSSSSILGRIRAIINRNSDTYKAFGELMKI